MIVDSSLVVVDTSVISLYIREHELADYYHQQIEGMRAVISFQTLQELWFGAYKAAWGDNRKNALRRYLDRYAVIWPTLEVVHISARLRAEREIVGQTLATADSWIAATAVMLKCPLASHDRDFSGIPGLQLIRAS